VVVAKTDRVNYTTLEDVPEGEQVLADMFSLHGHPIVILFDSPYMISTPGGRMATKHIVPKTPLDLGGRVSKVCLIILDGQGIEVILGMGWMKRHKVMLDTAAQMVHLDSPVHGSTTLKLSLPSVVPSSVHHTATQNLEDILVACEFPDVFPEDLPGMPPDRDVEFVIEL
jgi:hypothetical protein